MKDEGKNQEEKRESKIDTFAKASLKSKNNNDAKPQEEKKESEIIVNNDHPADYDSTTSIKEDESEEVNKLEKLDSQKENAKQQNQVSEEDREKVLRNFKRTEQDYEFNFDRNDRKLVVSIKKNTIIVVAAEGVGKTSYVDHEKMFGSDIVDEKSLPEFMYKKNEDGSFVLDENGEKVKDPEAFEKFMGHIYKTIEDGKTDILILPSYRNLIKALDENNIPYVLVKPDTRDLAMQYEMRQRYKSLGYSPEKIKGIAESWNLAESKTPYIIRLHPGEYLEDVMDMIEKLSETMFIVRIAAARS